MFSFLSYKTKKTIKSSYFEKLEPSNVLGFWLKKNTKDLID